MQLKPIVITEEDLQELQKDLEDAAVDFGAMLADRTCDENEDPAIALAKAQLPIEPLIMAQDRFTLASEKLRRAMTLFAKQKAHSSNG